MFRGQMQSFDFCTEALYQENCMDMLCQLFWKPLLKCYLCTE